MLVPMSGRAARNKGMALFPRKIGGKYMMIGRQDGENLFLLTSDGIDRLGRRRTADASPQYPVGIHPDRQLRRADRARRGLAAC